MKMQGDPGREKLLNVIRFERPPNEEADRVLRAHD
jgi:hypothetical protein